uniref:Uncharacterized protein n=1 Tax=Setaria italica TaxID=4555 RepID=K3Z172_SETIT
MSKEDVLKVQVRDLASPQLNPPNQPTILLVLAAIFSGQAGGGRLCLLVFAACVPPSLLCPPVCFFRFLESLLFCFAVAVTFLIPKFLDSGAEGQHTL